MKSIYILFSFITQSVRGNRIANDNDEEFNIHFQYADNTVRDIFQQCSFIIHRKSEQCEIIRIFCNTFIPITPRPLLERKGLIVCGDEVRIEEEEDAEATGEAEGSQVEELPQETIDELQETSTQRTSSEAI